MTGCLTANSPLAADCEFAESVKAVLLWSAIWGAMAYAVVVARPRGAGRYLQWLGGAFGVMFVLEPVSEFAVYGTAIPEKVAYAIGVTFGAGIGWRKRSSGGPSKASFREHLAHKRSSKSRFGATLATVREWGWDVFVAASPERAKTSFGWWDYGYLVMVLVAGQTGLAMLHGRFDGSEIAGHIGSMPLLSVDGASGRVTVWALFFVVSQFGIAFPARAIVNSLRHDWRVAEGFMYRREVLLLAVAGPCALCLVPAAFFGVEFGVEYGAVLASVLARLAVMVFAWWSTRRTEHPAHEVDFLKWGTVKVGLEAVRNLARAARRRTAAAGA